MAPRRGRRLVGGRRRHEDGTNTAHRRHGLGDTVTPGGLAPPLGGADRGIRGGPAGRARRSAPVSASRGTPRPLHVRSYGDADAPEIVCLHGVTSWGAHFARLAERLGDTHRVLAPDLLGHGDSPREPPWGIDDHLASIAASLAGQGPRTWLGHSFGGRLAFEHAARHADEVDRLVLLDPAILLPGHVAPLGRRERTPGPALRVLRGGDRPALRGEPAAPGAPRARRGGAPRPPRGGRRRMALPLHAGGRRDGLRRDGGRTASVHGRTHPDAARARGGLVPPVRPAPRRPPGRARRPARGRHGPRRAHRAVGRARRDGGRDRAASSRRRPVSPRSARPRARGRRRGSRRPPRPPRA